VKLTWKDILKAHAHVRKGLFTDEKFIWQREADYLNKLLKRKKKKK